MTDPLECGQPAEEMDTEYVDDPAEYVPFAPSCEEIPKDENLEYSDESFKQEIPVNEYSQDNIHLFPEPHVFAHFSIIAYDDNPGINSDLAPGWEVLTTARNTRSWYQAIFRTAPSNGYFGVAFWHPENRQLVIAHRGTIKTCIAAIKTDYYGVIQNEYVWQMFSAATFALEVVESLKNQKIHFHLFFTGHSLGGWLAQITTFTIKYLRLAQTYSAGEFINCFHRLTPQNIGSEESTSVHAHTVVFDSPGCKPMLLKLADGFDVRYSGKIVQVDELDITSYMSAPNWVNTRNAHVGTIYRLCFPIENIVSVENIGTSWINSFSKFKELCEKWDYTGAAHDKQNFLEVLLKENVQILEVVDWPESIGISGGKEFDGYLQWDSEEYAFPPPLKHSYSTELPGCYTIRYQVKLPEKLKRSLNVFTQNERDFLEQYRLVRTFQGESRTLQLSNEQHQNLLSDYKIDGFYVHSSSFEKLNQLAAGLPFLLRNYENLSEQVKAKLTPAGVATFDYLKSIGQNDYSFNSNLEIVATILKSADRIWEFTVDYSTAAFIRLVDSLKNKFFTDHHPRHFRYVALSYEKLMELTNDQTFLPQEYTKGGHIFVINCGHLNDGQKKKIKKLKDWLLQSKNTDLKLILISSSNSNWNGNSGISSLEWKDLSTDTKRRLMGKTICLQGYSVVLSNILFNMGRPENLSEEDLKPDFKLRESDIMRLMASDSLTVSVGGQPPRMRELEAAFVKCGNSKLFSFVRDKDSVVKFIEQCDEKNVIFCISVVTPSLSLEHRLKEIQQQNKNKVWCVAVTWKSPNISLKMGPAFCIEIALTEL